jgi:hypothetical protein
MSEQQTNYLALGRCDGAADNIQPFDLSWIYSHPVRASFRFMLTAEQSDALRRRFFSRYPKRDNTLRAGGTRPRRR